VQICIVLINNVLQLKPSQLIVLMIWWIWPRSFTLSQALLWLQ